MRTEAVKYVAGLAQRVEAEVIVLVLIRAEFDKGGSGGSDEDFLRDLQTRGEAIMGECLVSLNGMGIKARGVVRVGEPASEAMKFLAEDHALHSVVWGGDHKLPVGSRLKTGEHWIAMLKDKLDCPLVAP
ncbi:MAG: hypothetical protein ABIH66_12060 [bacterium]